MLTAIQKWGNSQGIRLSKAILSDAKISTADTVDITVKENEIIIRKANLHPATIKELFAGYSDEPFQAEISELGEPVGNELW